MFLLIYPQLISPKSAVVCGSSTSGETDVKVIVVVKAVVDEAASEPSGCFARSVPMVGSSARDGYGLEGATGSDDWTGSIERGDPKRGELNTIQHTFIEGSSASIAKGEKGNLRLAQEVAADRSAPTRTLTAATPRTRFFSTPFTIGQSSDHLSVPPLLRQERFLFFQLLVRLFQPC
jgi:hypothetical protein